MRIKYPAAVSVLHIGESHEFLINAMNQLGEELVWEDHDPHRKDCLFLRGADEYLYNRGRGPKELFPQPEPELLKELWSKVEEITGQKFEAVAINHYRGGVSHIGWHYDNSPSIDPERPIAILSLGSTRTIQFRHNERHDEVQSFELMNGVIAIMHEGCNLSHEHQVPSQPERGEDYRMSLVFRPLVNAR